MASGTLTVAAASIDTKNTRRGTHLRSADLFDSGKYPDITVAAAAPQGSGKRLGGRQPGTHRNTDER